MPDRSDANTPTLKLLPVKEYAGVDSDDPLRFYFWPVLGRMYRRRVELCLGECTGGKRVLEVGFGSGLSFVNLSEMYREVHGLDLKADIEKVSAVFTRREIRTHLRSGDVLDMPFEDDYFDTVLLISILEHLKPDQQQRAFSQIRRVLRPGGQVVYGLPVERPLMVWMFRLLGCDPRQHHFSTQDDVRKAAGKLLTAKRTIEMRGIPSFVGTVYEVGHFVKSREDAENT